MHSKACQELNPYIQLAPMEGVLDWILREMLSQVGGLDRMVTEFVRVTNQLLPVHVFKNYCPELNTGGKTLAGIPVFIQLLGGEAGPLADNAGRAAELGAAGIDLNFGCPAKTVNRHDGGAVLLKTPERLYQILKAVRAAVPTATPVTAKVRLGFENKDLHREIAHAVESGGAAQIVVHARTKLEMYQPPAHWPYIRSMSEGRDLPFVANGEIWTVQDYLACVEASGVTRVALGRGLVRNPFLALEIRSAFNGQPILRRLDRPRFFTEFYRLTCDWRGPTYALARSKQLLRYWSVSGPQELAWFNQVKVMSSPSQLEEFLNQMTSAAVYV